MKILVTHLYKEGENSMDFANRLAQGQACFWRLKHLFPKHGVSLRKGLELFCQTVGARTMFGVEGWSVISRPDSPLEVWVYSLDTENCEVQEKTT